MAQLTLTANGVDLTLTASGESVTLTADPTDLDLFLASGSGESNTGASFGGGEEVFRDKAGTVLNFRTITGSGGAVITTAGDTVNVDTSAAGTGDVVGPAAATDDAITRFDLTTGKLLQNSLATVDDSGNIATPGTVDGRDVSVDGAKLDGIEALAKDDQTITAGAGLTGGGAGDVTLDAVANADGSVIVNANDIQVGVLATDTQHGVRGGGTQHADVVPAGASGFMTGADKTKLNGVASGASATWTGLTDTPGTVTANTFVRGNAGGTALEQFDLLAAANTWSADQTHSADILPAVDQADDNLGLVTRRWDRIYGTLGMFLRGSGVKTLPSNANHGGLMAGTQAGVGINTHRLQHSTFPAVMCVGNSATNNAAGVAMMAAERGGASVIGSAYAYTASGDARIRATGYASTAIGYAYGSGTSLLLSSGAGATIMGYAHARSTTGNSSLRATGNGAVLFGFGQVFSGAGVSTMRSNAAGSFAAGSTRSVGGFSTTIEALGNGSFAQGRANAVTAIARIAATAAGSFAVGEAVDTTILASAVNSAQFGPGTNALVSSLAVGDIAGTGLRLAGGGLPGTPVDGDIWKAAGDIAFRSNGVTVGPFNQPSVTGSRASGAALVSLLTVLATANLIADNTVA